jgi:Tfp pilus assembly protein PilO
MAKGLTEIALTLKKLSLRERFMIALAVAAVLSWLIYQFPYRYFVKQTSTVKTTIEATEKDILGVAVQIADLKAREADIKAGRSRGIAGWDLADQKGVLMVLEDVSAEARREGVSLVGVHPSQEIDKDKYKEVTMNLDLKGRYRELAAYFQHLESLSHIVNIRKIRVEACPDASSACATQLEAVTYMAK